MGGGNNLTIRTETGICIYIVKRIWQKSSKNKVTAMRLNLKGKKFSIEC